MQQTNNMLLCHEAIGVIELVNKEDGQFTGKDERLMQVQSHMISNRAVENENTCGQQKR